jgi:hypothetical protein
MNSPVRALAEKFSQAFNQRDVGAIAALLGDGATAWVAKSGWPEERGKATILSTSIPHIMGDDGPPLAAEVWDIGCGTVVLLRRKSGLDVDTILKLTERGGKISSIEYLVAGFSQAEMASLVQPLGMNVCAPDV